MLFPQVYSSSWLAAFSLALTVFLLLILFTVCHAILDCLSSTSLQSYWSDFGCIVCSFRYTLVSSFCTFLSFWALILVGFLLLHREVVFMSACFFLTTNVSHGTLGLALWLVGMHSVTASKWALTKFSYLSFGVGVSDISWSALNLFLSVNTYLSLISLLLSRG